MRAHMFVVLVEMVSHDLLWCVVALLKSDNRTVFSRGYSGVASLPRDLSLSPSVVSLVLLPLLLLPCARVRALPLGAVGVLFFGAAAAAAEELSGTLGAAAAEALLLFGTLSAAAAEALATSSIGKRLSCCCCALCAARS